MHKGFIKIAAFFGVLSVILGAFTAHALKNKISGDAVVIFETGVRYQFYHTFALLAVGIIYKEFANKFLKWSGLFFTWGIILFSGSLYILTFLKGAAITGYDSIGGITPVGGLLFIAGWIFLFIGCAQKNK